MFGRLPKSKIHRRTSFRDTNAWLVPLTYQAFPASFYAGDALGSFNSWRRLLSGVLFGIAAVWLAFPYADAYFRQIRETLEEKFRRSAVQPSPAANKHTQ